MLLGKEKSCRNRSQTPRSLDRKKSLVKIPSTSKIPRDFFRPVPGSPQEKSSKSGKNLMEFTFNPALSNNSSVMNASAEYSQKGSGGENKKSEGVKRVGKRVYERSKRDILKFS